MTGRKKAEVTKPRLSAPAICLSAPLGVTCRLSRTNNEQYLSRFAGMQVPHLGVQAPERQNDLWCKWGLTTARGRANRDRAYAPRRLGKPPGSHLSLSELRSCRPKNWGRFRALPDRYPSVAAGNHQTQRVPQTRGRSLSLPGVS